MELKIGGIDEYIDKLKEAKELAEQLKVILDEIKDLKLISITK